jgi:formiminoglutamate deiminase
MRVTSFYCDAAWLGAIEQGVLISIEGDRIATIEVGVRRPDESFHLRGLILPGLVNVHSHAFHRALRAGTHGERGDFWSWRALMYRVAARLDPDTYYELARAVYGEMTLAGITTVGEFHYLHHDRDGSPYRDPNAMSEALVVAAADAGVRLTLLDTCYLRGGFGEPLEGPQLRFGDGSADAWGARVSAFRQADVVVGAAIHSVRAVDADQARLVASWAREAAVPLHFHLSEQPAENEACLDATGLTPTALLGEAEALGEMSTAVHATHPSVSDVELLAATDTGVCLCPTTERDLGDGIGPARLLGEAGVSVSLGSDSNAVIDLFEEARLVDLNERLALLERGGHDPARLLRSATSAGASALGWETGRLEAGSLADLIAVDLNSVRTAGAGDPLSAVVYAATAADVTDVVVGGAVVVAGRAHQRIADIPGSLMAAIQAVVA